MRSVAEPFDVVCLRESRQDEPFRAGQVRPGGRDRKSGNHHRRRAEDGQRGFRQHQILPRLQLSSSPQPPPVDYR